MPVMVLQQVLTSLDFAEELAFAELEPWGSQYEDARIARLQATMANLHGRAKNQPAFKVQDFLPDFTKSQGAYAPKEERIEKMRAIMDALVAAS